MRPGPQFTKDLVADVGDGQVLEGVAVLNQLELPEPRHQHRVEDSHSMGLALPGKPLRTDAPEAGNYAAPAGSAVAVGILDRCPQGEAFADRMGRIDPIVIAGQRESELERLRQSILATEKMQQ